MFGIRSKFLASCGRRPTPFTTAQRLANLTKFRDNFALAFPARSGTLRMKVWSWKELQQVSALSCTPSSLDGCVSLFVPSVEGVSS